MQVGSSTVSGQYQVSGGTVVQGETSLTNADQKSEVLKTDSVSISAAGQELLNAEKNLTSSDDGATTDGNGSGTLPPDPQASSSSTEIPGNGSGTLPPDEKPN